VKLMLPLSSLLFSAALLTGSALGQAPSTSSGQAYPNKPIRWIVPFPGGQASDILARTIGQKLTEAWGQQVLVDNRPGAGGNIGTDLAAKSPPDGYTIVMATAALPISVSVYSKLPFDPVKDFTPVSLLTQTPLVLVVNPSVPANSVKELIALAKSKPGEITFASSGNGTSHQLAGEMLKTTTGVKIVHVPYKGSAPAHVDLMGGQVTMMFDNIVAVLPHIKTGKLKPLAVTTPKRSPALPDVPTMPETGVPGFEATAWFGVLAPAGTPKEIIDKLNSEMVKILNMPDVKERFTSQGAEIAGSTPEEFAAFMKTEIEKWAKVAKESGARAD
jgi:tripartite-type tricarboxylate transporter receptor subunit TctC